MKLRMMVIAAAAALVGAVFPGTAAHADPWWLDYVVQDQFRNANSNKCLDVLWHSDDNGDPATQSPCAANEWEAGTHLWDAEWVGFDQGVGYRYALHLGYQGHLCLEVADYGTENFAPVDVHDCNGGPHQQWRVIPSGYSGTSRAAQWLADAVELQNVWSGKCLEVYEYSLSNVAIVDQYDCYKGTNQLWFREYGNIRKQR
ncbi:RICIN domain-containing protein [Dactylosporangium sp. NPDC049742]|uniref:RICIN domain-containing protein n=1 Tax=Dactylosporangium sp. NPDC049742 TaxID=3154737 RepID=UPI003442351C